MADYFNLRKSPKSLPWLEKLFLCSFILLIGMESFGQTIPTRYLESAAQHNPLLKAEYNQYRAEMERVGQVGLPDPEVNLGFFLMPMERYMGNQVASASIMQMIPWFGTLAASRNEAFHMAQARYMVFKEAKSQVYLDVKNAYYGLYFLEKQISITSQNLEILRTLENIALAQYTTGGNAAGNTTRSNNNMEASPPAGRSSTSGGMGNMGNMQQGRNLQQKSRTSANMETGMNNMSGGGSMVDVLKVQIEIKTLESNLEYFEDLRKPLLLKFSQLTGMAVTTPIVFPDSLEILPLPLPVAEMPDSIKQNNPMLQMLEAEEQAFMAMENMNKRMGMPMLGIGLQYEIFRPREAMGGNDMVSDMNGRNMLMPMVSFTIPIWRSKYKAGVKEAQLLREANGDFQANTEENLLVALADLQQEYKDTQRKFTLYATQSKLAQQSLNILMAQYGAGGTSFEEVLRMQQQLLTLHLNQVAALRDNHLAVAGMERLMGR